MITIRDVQTHVREVRAAHGWPDTTVEQQTLFLVTEVGEIAREVLRLAGPKPDDDPTEAREALGLEMFDVVWNLADLANKLGLDLDRAFARKMAINSTRNW